MDARRVCDRVYGEVFLPELAVRIAETPEFHRLDGVRQLGGCAFVYPSATHTRREHALGVCYLAGKMARHVARFADVDNDDILCLQVAGLVHDLGHGPFSHLFEDFMHEQGHWAWNHEEMGMRIFDLILCRHGLSLDEHMREHSAEENVAFIKALVRGLPREAAWPADIGRPAHKRFLFDIVSNHDSGLDVDKLDYLARDALAAFGTTRALNAMRIIRSVRVCTLRGVPTLAYDESVAFELADVFLLRTKLHRQLYQHRAVKVVEKLLCNAMRTIEREGDSISTRACSPELFALYTDATILDKIHSHDALRTRLYRRPWCRRLDVAVRVKTLPLCTRCGAETLVCDRYCAECGTPTSGRAYVFAGRSALAISEASALTDEDASAAVRARVEDPPSLEVHLIDIHVGREVALDDPWDLSLTWRYYDPLSSIPFWCETASKTDEKACWVGMRNDPFHIPRIRHMRIAHCYVENEADAASVARASRAFAAWGGEIGEVVALDDTY